ncbi:hypothetical protein BT96DRAFT_941742 [Gymnopus androsaceus JB14]|uniref:Uncharacterized protein n=1 Tax=Gymnopus androsaceus JB14 TaxID=1447944 RepID=A0A6A4HD83_9AGAR|nr:hypothetical protein BT96DRAFT_941742 [Gymnopus androsaceus JB14]
MREGELVEKAACRQQKAQGGQQRPKRQAGSSLSNSQVAMSCSRAISPRLVPTPPVVLSGGAPLTSSIPPPKAPTPLPSAPTPILSPIPLLVPSAPSPMFSPLVGQSANPSDRWSPVPHWEWSPPWLLERPGLDGAAYRRAHVDIASGRDPAITDLQDAYGDSHRLDPSHPIRWEPLRGEILIQSLRRMGRPGSYWDFWSYREFFAKQPLITNQDIKLREAHITDSLSAVGMYLNSAEEGVGVLTLTDQNELQDESKEGTMEQVHEMEWKYEMLKEVEDTVSGGGGVEMEEGLQVWLDLQK